MDVLIFIFFFIPGVIVIADDRLMLGNVIGFPSLNLVCWILREYRVKLIQ